MADHNEHIAEAGKLLPCPFCGDAELLNITQYKNLQGKPMFYVRCNSCRTDCGSYPTKKGAIAAWNRRPSPSTAPLTLEELRKMDGEPVYIVAWPDWGHWELSADAADYLEDRDPDFYGMRHDDPCGRFGLHMLGWLAYRRKPEEDA